MPRRQFGTKLHGLLTWQLKVIRYVCGYCNDDSYKWDAFLPFFRRLWLSHLRIIANVLRMLPPDHDLKAIGPRGGPLSVTFPNYGQP